MRCVHACLHTYLCIVQIKAASEPQQHFFFCKISLSVIRIGWLSVLVSGGKNRMCPVLMTWGHESEEIHDFITSSQDRWETIDQSVRTLRTHSSLDAQPGPETHREEEEAGHTHTQKVKILPKNNPGITTVVNLSAHNGKSDTELRIEVVRLFSSAHIDNVHEH